MVCIAEGGCVCNRTLLAHCVHNCTYVILELVKWLSDSVFARNPEVCEINEQETYCVRELICTYEMCYNLPTYLVTF